MNRRFFPIFLLVFFLAFLPLLSITAQAKTHPTKTGQENPPALIETKMAVDFLGILGTPMIYTRNGKVINGYREFKDIIYPLRDKEASDMIRAAEAADTVAWVLNGIGVATGIDVLVAYKPVPVFGVDWMDRILSGFAASQVFIGIGLLFEGNSGALKYNAVQRYNHLINTDKSSSLGIEPRLFADQGHWDLGLGTRF